MTAAEVCRHIERIGVVPVVRASSAELAERAAEAVLAGGVSVFEITMTVPNAIEAIGRLCARYGDRALIGAGTVLTVDQARAAIEAGAKFIVSPGLDVDTVEFAKTRDIASMPGALTPTEVLNALRAGADMVKIFPCSAVGGAKYLKALRAPLPDVKLLPTGGVSLSTVSDFILAGAAAVGVGAELIDIEALKAGQDHLLTDRAARFVSAIQGARRGHPSGNG